MAMKRRGSHSTRTITKTKSKKHPQPRVAQQPDSNKSKKKQATRAMVPNRYFKRSGVLPFLKFPYEIQTMIFKLLNPITSTCLGLTCRDLYQIHRKYNGNVGLRCHWNEARVGYLPYLLEKWMSPRVFRFGCKFYTNEQLENVMARMAEQKEDKRKAKLERKMEKKAKKNGTLAAA